MRLRYESDHPHHEESEQSHRARMIDKKREKRQEPQLDEQVVARAQVDLAREREERRLAEEQARWSPRENVEPDELLDAESAPRYAGMAHLNTYTEKARAWFTGKRAQGKRVEKGTGENRRDTIRGKIYKTAQEIEAEASLLNLQERELAFCARFNVDNIKDALAKNADAALSFILTQSSFEKLKNFDALVDMAEQAIVNEVGKDANYALILESNWDHPDLPIKMKRLDEALRIARDTIEKSWGRRQAA